MDFIERIFGISPDGGSGAFEFLLFAIPILILVSLAMRGRAAKRGRDQSGETYRPD